MKEEMNLRMALGQKILNVMSAIGTMEKDGKNTQSHYDYISSENMLAKLKKILPEHNLAIIPSATDFKEEYFTTQKGQNVQRTIVKMNFILMDTETGVTMEVPWVGADQDYGGKSCGQALTEACKRFYFKLFFVSSIDDKDPDSKTVTIEKNTEYPKTKAGFMQFVIDNGYSKDEVSDIAHKVLGENPTNDSVAVWVKVNGWNIKKIKELL